MECALVFMIILWWCFIIFGVIGINVYFLSVPKIGMILLIISGSSLFTCLIFIILHWYFFNCGDTYFASYPPCTKCKFLDFLNPDRARWRDERSVISENYSEN